MPPYGDHPQHNQKLELADAITFAGHAIVELSETIRGTSTHCAELAALAARAQWTARQSKRLARAFAALDAAT